ncbi:hypothetical protein PHSC3_000546 [Chlamydiales bacterium STE3]|nr:hypothetical protein PHSC3_000546 [Chlamydiales bacterium STE3]
MNLPGLQEGLSSDNNCEENIFKELFPKISRKRAFTFRAIIKIKILAILSEIFSIKQAS